MLESDCEWTPGNPEDEGTFLSVNIIKLLSLHLYKTVRVHFPIPSFKIA